MCRELVQKTYIPPQVPEDIIISTLAEQYMFDFRRIFIEHPRLRLDGVYIAVCHYMLAHDLSAPFNLDKIY